MKETKVVSMKMDNGETMYLRVEFDENGRIHEHIPNEKEGNEMKEFNQRLVDMYCKELVEALDKGIDFEMLNAVVNIEKEYGYAKDRASFNKMIDTVKDYLTKSVEELPALEKAIAQIGLNKALADLDYAKDMSTLASIL